MESINISFKVPASNTYHFYVIITIVNKGLLLALDFHYTSCDRDRRGSLEVNGTPPVLSIPPYHRPWFMRRSEGIASALPQMVADSACCWSDRHLLQAALGLESSDQARCRSIVS